MPPFSIQTHTAGAVCVGDLRVIPEYRVLSLRLPFAALVVSRPSAVIVETASEGRRIPISRWRASTLRKEIQT